MAERDLDNFLSEQDFDLNTYNDYADLVYASGRDRERFDSLINEQRSASGAAKLNVAIGLLILNRFSEAIEWFDKAGAGKTRDYFKAQAARALNRYDEAVEAYAAAAKAGWDSLDCELNAAVAEIRAGKVDAAAKRIAAQERAGVDRAVWHYASGYLAEANDDREAAAAAYAKALQLDANHSESLFRMAWLSDLAGDDEQAIELYEQLASRPRAHVNALINLAVVFEDRNEYDRAAAALRRVLGVIPNHARARLFLRDVESSRSMVINEDAVKRDETRNRLLETPISEFELSVRARNCLKKMQIRSLGDLLKLSEAELLSYKNFGETSLNEIKNLLSKRGLRLGQRPEEIDISMIQTPVAPTQKVAVPAGSEGVLAKPVSEMELSVRARRCLQRLSISTIGDLIQHTEPELLSTRNFGVTSLNEIKARLSEMNLSLATKQ